MKSSKVNLALIVITFLVREALKNVMSEAKTRQKLAKKRSLRG